ncbi:MAG: HD domain-containing protein, partial [Dehalococcoidales bacterium]|nr:HD domain-containing protein [Dehalococcoidales bacterium]
KPGKLNEIEYLLIKSRPQIGFDVLKNIEFPFPLSRWVLQHHERLNGSGYPGGLKDKEISRGARILAVADVVESMISHRPYRPGLGIEAALEEITKGKGSLYDPEAVEACIRLFKEKGFKF